MTEGLHGQVNAVVSVIKAILLKRLAVLNLMISIMPVKIIVKLTWLSSPCRVNASDCVAFVLLRLIWLWNYQLSDPFEVCLLMRIGRKAVRLSYIKLYPKSGCQHFRRDLDKIDCRIWRSTDSTVVSWQSTDSCIIVDWFSACHVHASIQNWTHSTILHILLVAYIV